MEIEKKSGAAQEAGERYELAYHLVPTIAEGALDAEVAAVRKALADAGGSLISEEAPKRLALAYTMEKRIGNEKKKFDEAYFGWLVFEASPEAVVEVTTRTRANESVLRFLLIRAEEETDAPAPRRRTPRSPVVVGDAPAKEKSDSEIEADETHIDEEIDKLVAV